MDEQKELIIDRRNGFLDITNSVQSIEVKGAYVEIVFRDSNQVFRYARKNIIFANDPRCIENDIAINGNIILNATRKLLFGKFLKLFFQERPSQLHHGDFTILEGKITAGVMGYLRDVARLVKVLPSNNNMGEQQNTILAEALDNITLREDGPLYHYLSGNLDKPNSNPGRLIFPFRCNESQLLAVKRAFSNTLSLIQGPPGTGKTQTILNILANAIIRGQKVAVVSNNNSAIQNIVEKLSASEGLDFIAALLGKRENQENFLQNQPPYPLWLGEKIDCNIRQVQSEIFNLHYELERLFQAENELKKTQMQLDAWRVEREKFVQCYPDSISLQTSMTSETLMGLLRKCNRRYIQNKGLSFWFRLWQILLCRFSFGFWMRPLGEIVTALKGMFYKRKCDELESQVSVLKAQLKNAGLEEKHKRLNECSMLLLKAKLQDKYGVVSTRRKILRIRRNDQEFSDEYPVILSTTFLIHMFTPPGGFDLLVMDEASQVDLCTGINAISCAKNIVIVGDEKQLPCVITAQDERLLSRLNTDSIPPAYKFCSGQSILTSLKNALPDVAQTILKEHYRCAPQIIGFCNQRFYGGELIIHTNKDKDSAMKIVYTAPGNHARGHLNLRQCQEINMLVNTLIQEKHYTEDSIGICTPYCEQAEHLGASTVHKFQGREKDIIIMSTVDNQINGFSADDQLVNVAVSRAKKRFYLVLSSSNQSWNNCIGDLVNYIWYHGKDSNLVIYGQIRSAFDLLYAEYQDTDASWQQMFDSPAEQIIYGVLWDILQKYDRNKRYDFKMHIPLREIFQVTPELSKEEAVYLMNANTHVDFLIYEKYGKTPRFGLEVDGYTYHKNGTRQAERDLLKNSIFSKCHIPLLRLMTNDSDEYNRIFKFLFSSNNGKR